MELHEDPFFRAVVDHKTNLLVYMQVITESDREDVSQALYCDLLAAMRLFDPNKAHRNVFVTVVLDRSVADMVRRFRASKRSGKPMSLSTLVRSGEEVSELLNLVSETDLKRRLGNPSMPSEIECDMRRDIDAAIERLPPPLKRMALLLKEHNLSVAARRMGLPRSTAEIRVIQIRAQFKRQGLQEYLKKRPAD